MKTLKVSLITAVFLMTAAAAFGQVRFGVKANFGSSWISSGNLKNNLEFQANGDVDIKEWDVSYRPGTTVGVGGVASYELSSKLSLQGELSFNYQKSKVLISYLEDNRGQAGNGETETVDSEAKILSTRLSIPLSVHYSLGLDKPVLLAGLEANLFSTPQIESIESEVVKEFANGDLVGQQTDSEAFIGDLDVFNTVRFNFLLGVAKSVDLAGEQLSVQLTYHLPLSSSEMYNFNNRVAFDDNTFRNNQVFGALGKNDAEQDAPAFPLDDFKMHFFDFSITYLF